MNVRGIVGFARGKAKLPLFQQKKNEKIPRQKKKKTFQETEINDFVEFFFQQVELRTTVSTEIPAIFKMHDEAVGETRCRIVALYLI